MNNKVTSKNMGSLASETLTSTNSSAMAKKLAGSALSQVNKGNQTGSAMEGVASKVLKSNKYCSSTKSLAASLLSQSNKKR